MAAITGTFQSRTLNQGDPAVRPVSDYRSLRNIFHLEKILQTNRENPDSCGGKVIKEELSSETSSWEEDFINERTETLALTNGGGFSLWSAAAFRLSQPNQSSLKLAANLFDATS